MKSDGLVLDEPTNLPEGTVIDLVADDEGDDLTDEERRALPTGCQHRGDRRGLEGFDRPPRSWMNCASAGERSARTTPEADIQILEIDDWWRANRQTSPDL